MSFAFAGGVGDKVWKGRGDMKVISQNSDAEIAKNRARDGLRWPLRRMTANLMRIVRGAGNPGDLPNQISDVVEAYQAYQAAFCHWPDGVDLQQALALDERGRRDDIEDAHELIVKGALRLVAGRLIGQTVQARHGEKDMTTGMRHRDEIREENRRQRRTELLGKRSPKRRPVVL
jgi:hypothetical protein